MVVVLRLFSLDRDLSKDTKDTNPPANQKSLLGPDGPRR